MSPIIVLCLIDCLFVVSAMFQPSLKGDQVAWLTKKIGESQKFNLCRIHNAQCTLFMLVCILFTKMRTMMTITISTDDDDGDGDGDR